MTRIAVAIIHGIEIDDADFALTPTRLLKEEFAKAVGPGGPDPDDVLVVEPILWSPHLETRQQELFERLYPTGRGAPIVDYLMARVRQLNAGGLLPMLPLALALLAPVLPRLSSLRYPGLRWVAVHFLGDVIAYDRGTSPDNYAAAHEALAHGLAALARRAGPQAPLAVFAHSFGTVLISDYVYDRQETERGGVDLVPPSVRRASGESPLARGETLTWLYTMGSPLALWSLRYPDGEIGRPIELRGATPAAGEWVNLYAKEDVIAYPLRPLGPAYERAVDEDRAVSLTRSLLRFTPLVHGYYWSDRNVMRTLARSLAEGWRRLDAAQT